MTTTAVLWQMMYRIKDSFIHVLNIKHYIMNMINKKQLYVNHISLGRKKVNKMRHFIVIADLNIAQKKI